jgi:hypothetical protein
MGTYDVRVQFWSNLLNCRELSTMSHLFATGESKCTLFAMRENLLVMTATDTPHTVDRRWHLTLPGFGVPWSLYVLISWGLVRGVDTWRVLFQRQGYAYDRAFHKWERQQTMLTTVEN